MLFPVVRVSRDGLCGAIAALILTCAASAADQRIRVASYNAELFRKGPGLLLRDIRRGNDPQIAAVIEVIATTAPDILALQGFDWDHDAAALTAFADALRAAGQDYPHLFAARPNRGEATALDMDGDGRRGGARDAQGFGAFTGQGGMAVLSRFPIAAERAQDFTDLLWRDLPGALLPTHPDGAPFPSADALAVQKLASTASWVLPIRLPDGRDLTLLTFHPGPPVFDGPEDRNGRRNHDEIMFWVQYLDGRFGRAPDTRFVVAASAVLDPHDSDGRHVAIRSLLDHPRLSDTRPDSAGATAAPDQGHKGPNALDTVDWPPPGPGRLRVDYVLPSRDWRLAGSEVFWPAPDDPAHKTAANASRHRLVWVDLVATPAP